MANALILPRERWPALLDAATCQRDRALLSVLLWVGLPIGRAVALDLRDIIWSEEDLRVGERRAYAHPCCLRELVEYLPERLEPRPIEGNPLFVSERRSRLCVRRAREIVHEAGVKVGCPGLRPQTLRVSTAAHLAKRQASLQEIADQLGYAEPKTARAALLRLGVHARSAPGPQSASVASLLRSGWRLGHYAPECRFWA